MSVAAAVLMHCGSVMAADLRVCVDDASPTVDVDARFATAVAKAQGVPLSLFKYRGTPRGDDDDFELRRYKSLLDENCDLVVGFPSAGKANDFPAFLKATKPYASTGFVLVTRQSDPATTLAALPADSHLTVGYNTIANFFFKAYPNLVRDIEADENDAVDAVDAVGKGSAVGAMVWRGSAVRHLENTKALDKYRLQSLDEPYARYDLVGLYNGNHPEIAKAFDKAVDTLRKSGELDRALGRYADTGTGADTGTAMAGMGVSEARRLVMDATTHRDARKAPSTCAAPSTPASAAAPAPKAATPAAGAADALYADAQAAAGQQVYADHCALCHGKQLEGMAGPSLKSKFFLPADPAHSLGDIFTIVSDNMPATEPGSLEKGQYVQIMAFLLKENGYPAGPTELTFDSAKASTVKLKYMGK